MDRELLRIVKDYDAKHIELRVIGDIRSGKDARVVLVTDKDGNQRALKIYRKLDERHHADNQQFLAGRFYRNAGIQRKIKHKNRLSQNILKKVWSKREYFLLKELHSKGVPVPAVFSWTESTILMEFIGSNETPAPRLQEIPLTPELAKQYQETLLTAIETMLECNVIHGDLSAYNVLVHNDQLYIIDFPQAVDPRTNDRWESILERDKHNITIFFDKYITD